MNTLVTVYWTEILRWLTYDCSFSSVVERISSSRWTAREKRCQKKGSRTRAILEVCGQSFVFARGVVKFAKWTMWIMQCAGGLYRCCVRDSEKRFVSGKNQAQR